MARHFPLAALFLILSLVIIGTPYAESKVPVSKEHPLEIKSMFGEFYLTGPCKWMNTEAKEMTFWMTFCKRARVRAALRMASQLAGSYCRELFQYEPWNCSTAINNLNVFQSGKLYRETAMMYAMSAAALTHAVAQTCSEGRMKGCRCKEKSQVIPGMCSEAASYKFARRFIRHFLKVGKLRTGIFDNLIRHNINIGIQAVGQLRTKCVCRGVSRFCATKICWKSLKRFREIAEFLKQHYFNAQQFLPWNRPKAESIKMSSRTKLLYLDKSPNLCTLTHGRRCRDPENCDELCCYRGYIKYSITKEDYCKCVWRKYYSLTCELCSYNENIYICK